MKQNENRLMASLGRIAVSLTVLLACVAPAGATPFRDLTWNKMESGTTNMLQILTGSSDSVYYSTGTTIRKYNPGTGTWDDLTSWTNHVTGNANWSGVTSVSVTAGGGNLYVMAFNLSHNQIGYYNGTSWSDIAVGTTRLWYSSMAADGTTAVNIGNEGGGVVTVKVVDGAMASGFPEFNMQNNGLFTTVMSIDGNGSGVYWARNSGNRVSKSTDGGIHWTEVATLPTSGVSGNYSIHSIDADHAIASQASTGRVYRTSNGGATWELVGGAAFVGSNARGIYVNGWDDIVAYGSFNGLYHWNGTNWAHITLPDHLDSQTLRAMTYVDGHYWVAGNDGVMYSTLPEPATLCLLAAGGLLTVVRKKR